MKFQIYRGMQIFVRDPGHTGPDFVCVPSRGGEALEVWHRELAPTVSETLRLKLEPWVEYQAGLLLAEVESKVS